MTLNQNSCQFSINIFIQFFYRIKRQQKSMQRRISFKEEKWLSSVGGHLFWKRCRGENEILKNKGAPTTANSIQCSSVCFCWMHRLKIIYVLNWFLKHLIFSKSLYIRSLPCQSISSDFVWFLTGIFWRVLAVQCGN